MTASTWDTVTDKGAALAAAGWFMLSIQKSVELASAPAVETAGAILRLAHVLNAALLLLIVVFLVSRRPPVNKAPGLWPRLVAWIGLLAPLALALIPRASLGQTEAIGSALLVFAGTLAGVWAVTHLGRAFSFFPQARTLVTSGPYRFVRHPLYLAELAIVAGLAIERSQPWSSIIFVLTVVSQVPRMHYEERVLSESFPEYVDYMHQTYRLVPGIY